MTVANQSKHESVIEDSLPEGRHTGKDIDLPCASFLKPSVPGLSLANVPATITNFGYGVRGAVLDRAMELQASLSILPFDKILPCHIGNPHAVGSPSVTYIRECLSLLLNPQFTSRVRDDTVNELQSKLAGIYNPASIRRAQNFLRTIDDIGSYSHSRGSMSFIQAIQKFLYRRDGVFPPPESLFITNGASDAITSVLECLIGGPSDGIIIPMPQYPLYTATITKLNGSCVFYELDEDNGWGISIEALEKAYNAAIKDNILIKGLVIINPGNPAPSFLNYKQIDEILTFCYNRNIPVLADEVYQDNVYHGAEWFSFRKVLHDKEHKTQLVTFHSASKGYYGECGFRGGFMQFENVTQDWLQIVYKVRSLSLCSNTMGQAAIALVCSPPLPDDADYALYLQERTHCLDDLAEKAEMVYVRLNALKNVSCQPIRGAMYAFPRIEFPETAAAKILETTGQKIDTFYALQLLESTGIVSTPGNAFGQREGTYHLRLTILPDKESLSKALELVESFHISFFEQHCSSE